jgi:hypothetical protein
MIGVFENLRLVVVILALCFMLENVISFIVMPHTMLRLLNQEVNQHLVYHCFTRLKSRSYHARVQANALNSCHNLAMLVLSCMHDFQYFFFIEFARK